MKIIPLRISEITLSFTYVLGKSHSTIFANFILANMAFKADRKIKILAKISEFTVFNTYSTHNST